jgi:4-amino-4-deoxy-L-arabinose transferase-like glycosyltransferase
MLHRILDIVGFFENRIGYSLALVSGLALGLRLVYIVLWEAEVPEGDDPWYYLQIAGSILSGDGFREGNLLAYRPPLYPYLIAACHCVFGSSLTALRIVQAFLAKSMCLGIFYVARLSNTVRGALLASFSCAIYPSLIHYSVQVWSEQVFMFLIVAAMFSLLLSEKKSSWLLRIGTGVLLGLAALTREAALLLTAGLLVWLVRMSSSWYIGLKKWSVIVLFSGLTILPWSIRNCRTFGEFVPIATNGGVNFYIGNNEKASGTFEWALPPGAVWQEYSPDGSFELEASRLGYKRGLSFVIKNPGRFLVLTVRRVSYLLRPPYSSIDLGESTHQLMAKLVWLTMYIAFFVLAFLVAPFRFKGGMRSHLLWLIAIGMLALPYVVTYAATRYRITLMPFVIIIASAAMDDLCRKANRI